MITGIGTLGKYLELYTANSTNFYQNGTALGAGNVRYNANDQGLEVYDGNNWKKIDRYAHLQLSHEAIGILDWAKEKMAEEDKLKELADSHPAVQAAVENFNRAKEQLEVTVLLSTK